MIFLKFWPWKGNPNKFSGKKKTKTYNVRHADLVDVEIVFLNVLPFLSKRFQSVEFAAKKYTNYYIN